MRLTLTEQEWALVHAVVAARVAADEYEASLGVPPRTYASVRAQSNYMVLGSTIDGMEWTWHGYQAGGVIGGYLPAEQRKQLGGRAMTDDEWAAKVAELAAVGVSVYAIPVKDNAVGRNICLHPTAAPPC
jgi:hypothetical protein